MAKTVTLSIKNVPADVARRLRERALRNHRSMQGELLAILEDAGHRLTPGDLVGLTKRLKLKTAADSAQIIRDLRDDRG